MAELGGAAHLATEHHSDVSLSATPNGHVEIIPSAGWLAAARHINRALSEHRSRPLVWKIRCRRRKLSVDLLCGVRVA